MLPLQYGICPLSAVAMRREPADTSEMVSQLLFGETFTILKEQHQWLEIKCTHDAYIGWIDRKQCLPLSPTDYDKILMGERCFTTDTVNEIVFRGKHTPILWGSTLPCCKAKQGSIGHFPYQYYGDTVPATKSGWAHSEKIIEHALLFINAPYLWGGRSMFGIDCSGFTQLVFKVAGINLQRDAYQQAQQGSMVLLPDHILPTDLLFFDNASGKITHVGIALGNGKLIHASGCVRIDSLSNNSIIHSDTQEQTHRLKLIKRFLPDTQPRITKDFNQPPT